MGDVIGAEGKTYGIGSANITNCYYICTVGTEKKSDYIQEGDEATATTITVDVYKRQILSAGMAALKKV